MKPTVIVVAGPTASGKTALGVALAKQLGGEVISADSMQIYKRMTIATAKPTTEEMQGIPHHLIDIVEPWEPFSVAKFQQLALARIAEVLSRGKLPILVGGTGLYLDAVMQHTTFLDCEETPIRATLQEKANALGNAALLEELRAVDPQTAERLHVNDTKRILRALELYYATGQTMSVQRENSHHAENPYRFCKLLLTTSDRAFLYARINRRVDRMLEQGLLDEAKAFFALENAKTAKQAIGYKEFAPYFRGECTLAAATEKLKMETRRYAKRQLTWFRKYDDLHPLYIDEASPEELLRQATEIYQKFLGEQNETFA